MLVRDLVETCQNQWIGLFKYNPLFTIHFRFKDCENLESYKLTDFQNYTIDGVSNDYIYKKISIRHNQTVLSWNWLGNNDLFILVEKC